MKKILFLLAITLTSFLVNAQVTATIVSVEPVTTGKYKGDIVTFTVSAENNKVYGVTVLSKYDGHKGHVGLWDPNAASYTTGTYSVFVGYMGKLPNERTYTVQVWTDEPELTYSEPVTVTK